MRIAPRRRGLGRGARHRARARWDDDIGTRVPYGDRGVDVVSVVGAVAGEGSDRTVGPVEQGTALGAIVGFPAGQRRCEDPAGGGVRREAQTSPGPAPLDRTSVV